jgi:hypothetical protein
MEAAEHAATGTRMISLTQPQRPAEQLLQFTGLIRLVEETTVVVKAAMLDEDRITEEPAGCHHVSVAVRTRSGWVRPPPR